MRIDTLAIQEVDQEGLDHLASTHGCVERFLSCPMDYEGMLPGLGGGAHEAAQPASVVALLQHICKDIAPPVTSGMQMLAMLQENVKLLPIGCPSVDRLLRGGVRQGFVVELAGETASGKTQLCHMAAVNAVNSDYRVLYLDTTTSFCAARAQQLSRLLKPPKQGTRCMTDTELLASISVVRPHSIHALLSSLDQLLVTLSQVQAAPSSQPGQPSSAPGLVIVDSISATLSPVLGGQQHHQGQTLVACLGHLLKELADRHNMAVLVTNHVVSTGSSAEAGYKPALGELWRTQAHVRLQLSRGAGDMRYVALTSSSMDACPFHATFNFDECHAS